MSPGSRYPQLEDQGRGTGHAEGLLLPPCLHMAEDGEAVGPMLYKVSFLPSLSSFLGTGFHVAQVGLELPI